MTMDGFEKSPFTARTQVPPRRSGRAGGTRGWAASLASSGAFLLSGKSLQWVRGSRPCSADCSSPQSAGSPVISRLLLSLVAPDKGLWRPSTIRICLAGCRAVSQATHRSCWCTGGDGSSEMVTATDDMPTYQMLEKAREI